jgi:hypothetical protein
MRKFCLVLGLSLLGSILVLPAINQSGSLWAAISAPSATRVVTIRTTGPTGITTEHTRIGIFCKAGD